jgi:hypothetical protein
LASCDDDQSPASAGLLVLHTSDPAEQELTRLYGALDARGFRRGHLVGTVLPVMASTNELSILADYVDAAASGRRPPEADTDLLDALALVNQFAWDEGAEIF